MAIASKYGAHPHTSSTNQITVIRDADRLLARLAGQHSILMRIIEAADIDEDMKAMAREDLLLVEQNSLRIREYRRNALHIMETA